MHELALSHSIVDIAAECGRREGLCRITRVVVEIGEAAVVDPEGLSFCFGIVAADTLAQGAELSIEKIALRAACRACAAEFEPPHVASPCPRCGAYGASLLRGRELRVKSLDGE
jgi:hydrogenase nickel incorporation protein HypA/HybF